MGRIRVLLVDDNRLATEYLSGLIDWEKAGFEIVGVAIDGREAFRCYEKWHPQLIITDISMPGMDGITLSKEIRKIDRNVRIIFLSSYDEFDYARSALQLHVSEYILKHELDGEHLMEKLAIVREELVREELWQKTKAREALTRFFTSVQEECPVAGAKDFFQAVLLVPDRPVPGFSGGEKELAWPATLEEELLEEVERAAHVLRPWDREVLLLLEGSLGRPLSSLEKIRRLAGRLLGTSCSLIVFPPGLDLGKIREELLEKAYLRFSCWFLGWGQVVPAQDYPALARERQPKSPWEGEAGRFRDLLQEGEGQKISAYLSTLFDSLEKDWDGEGLLRVSASLWQALCQESRASLGEEPLLPRQELELASQVESFLLEASLGFLKKKQERAQEGLSRYTRQVLSYVQAHYPEADLSVEKVAAHIGIGVNYLNQVFREEMGMTVHRYLAQVRLEKAKELLSSTQIRIGAIPAKVGYTDSSYFSKVFKKATGMTPYEYRQAT